MWTDRDMDEHSVYDHRPAMNGGLYASTGAQTLPSSGSNMGITTSPIYNGSVYGTLTAVPGPMNASSGASNGYGTIGGDPDQHSNSLPPPPPPMEGTYSAISHEHPTLPLESHYSRIPAGNGMDYISGNGVGHAASGVVDGGSLMYGVLDNSHPDSSMMMMATPEEFDSRSISGNFEDKSSDKLGPDSHSLLMMYADRFGLNERGCYVSTTLAIIAFIFFVIIVTLGACWPGKAAFSRKKNRRKEKYPSINIEVCDNFFLRTKLNLGQVFHILYIFCQISQRPPLRETKKHTGKRQLRFACLIFFSKERLYTCYYDFY